MRAATDCTSCGNQIEQGPGQHPDPVTCRNLLCARCYGESHWAWLMWRGSPVPNTGGTTDGTAPEQRSTAMCEVTRARTCAIGAAILADMIRKVWVLQYSVDIDNLWTIHASTSRGAVVLDRISHDAAMEAAHKWNHHGLIRSISAWTPQMYADARTLSANVQYGRPQ